MGRGDRERGRGGRERERGRDRHGAGLDREHRERAGSAGEGFVSGSSGGYGHGGALEYRRDGFAAGARPADRGDTRDSSGSGWSRAARDAGRDDYAGGAGYGGIGYGGDGYEPHEDRGFAGRGPKGYRRPDERIHEEVCERLTRHPAIDASDIEVRVAGGEVTLTGEVDSRRTKRLVEDVVDRCGGVVDVANQLRITRQA
jgi:hypothetical protein